MALTALPSRDTVRKPRRRGRISRPTVLARRGQLWDALLQAAGRLMAERGVAGVSVEQILVAAGLSRGTFYGYCRNKSELVAAIIEPVFREGTAVLNRIIALPPAEVMPSIASLYLDLWARRRDALLMIPGVDAEAFALLRDAHTAYTDAMQRTLEQAAAGGQLRNGSASYSFRVLTRTAVPLLRVYQDHPDGARLYRDSMLALLVAA